MKATRANVVKYLPDKPGRYGQVSAAVTACGAKVKIEDTTASHRVNVGLRPLCSRCVAAKAAQQNVPVA